MQANKKDAQPIKTILTISVGFLVVFAITRKEWAMWVSLLVGGAGLLSPYLAGKIDWLWGGLANIAGMVFPKILFGMVFYCFLFPISLISKLFRKNSPLFLKGVGNSTYIAANKEFGKAGFEVPW